MRASLIFGLVLLGTFQVANAEEVWRCPGNRYVNGPNSDPRCQPVQATQSTGTTGEKVFIPKGGKLKSPANKASLKRDPRKKENSNVLFETQDSRPLQSSTIDHSKDQNSGSQPAVGSEMRCILATLLNDERGIEGCGGKSMLKMDE